VEIVRSKNKGGAEYRLSNISPIAKWFGQEELQKKEVV
jgi:hypothetical protein